MLSTKKVVSAMIGLAMLALPTTALAGHHEDRGERARPYTQHDNGWHRGWFKHQGPAPIHGIRPGWQNQNWQNQNYGYTPTNPWWRHDGDGDNYRQAWRQEPDADDYNNGNWGSNYNYGQPPSYYSAVPPYGYGNSQQLSWLLQRRQAALANLNLMRARGDSRAAARMVQVLNGLNARIRRLQGGYAPPVAYSAPLTPYLGNLFGNGYNPTYGNAYPPAYGANDGNAYSGYGNPYYGNSPTANLLGSLVGPILGSGLVH